MQDRRLVDTLAAGWWTALAGAVVAARYARRCGSLADWYAPEALAATATALVIDAAPALFLWVILAAVGRGTLGLTASLVAIAATTTTAAALPLPPSDFWANGGTERVLGLWVAAALLPAAAVPLTAWRPAGRGVAVPILGVTAAGLALRSAFDRAIGGFGNPEYPRVAGQLALGAALAALLLAPLAIWRSRSCDRVANVVPGRAG